jgi:hypothetical protein
LVLDKGRIATRGSWDELKSSVSELTKFTFAQAEKRPEPATKIAKGKSQSTADAEEDLYRKTGDFSLYCEFQLTSSTPKSLTKLAADGVYSVLPQVCWCQQRDFAKHMLGIVLLRHVLPAVPVKVVDGRASRQVVLLHGWLHRAGCSSLGGNEW